MSSDNIKNWTRKQNERQRLLQISEKKSFAKRQFLSGKHLLFIVLLAAVVLPALIFGLPFLQSSESVSELIVQGNTITVRKGGDVQAAIKRAKAGDTILLEAGATFKGNFILPKKSGNEFITIRSSASDAQLPPADVRLEPAKYSQVLPKLVAVTQGKPLILTEDGAHHYRFIGIDFGNTIEGFFNIIQIGTTEEKSVEDLPHHIEFDRVFIHGHPTLGQRRGIAANGRSIVIKNSHISDIKRKGEESQAIAVWATDGPVEITNNYLEAAAENILFGGAESYLQLIPTNCIVRGNRLNKPPEWRNTEWVVKNLFEIKNGWKIIVENNLMTNNWAMGQDGSAILFTVREDSGKNALIEDVEFRNNIVRGSSNALNVYGDEGAGGRRLAIVNNIFDEIDNTKFGGNGFFMKSTAWDGLIIENNTIIQTGNITSAYGKPIRNFVFRNNIVYQNEYGFMGDGMSPGKVTLNTFFPNAKVTNNIIIGSDAAKYGTQNFYPSTLSQIGFINFREKDFRLKKESPYLTKGCDGKQIGANLNPQTVGSYTMR